ncbi:Membrane protein mosC [[Actinomadura] parvosata subsp. kistnae]|uniref:MFS transporter n=1 Tax=[Actinomadura] parvosata subsp. kistnae TaxID=1909395 RepID=A0A1V0A194_9ACTN|nr:MFS transporter [Nonomuraea sp. ATCC 55076]AQZ63957.1 MFS transporter [Nonomuraea sp. ATCC 55076]SPL89821.1 Membrane protein mosC [Actinomadura parvosata subsp. kistnae]
MAVYLLFFLSGTAIGTWTARIPAIKERLALSDGRLSIALLAVAAGAVIGMTVVGRLVDRYGSSRAVVPAALAQGVVLVPPAYAPDLVTLSGTLLVFGIVHGILDVSMNANAVEVERGHGRPIMSSFHAVYSVGGFAGATAGGLFAHRELSAAVTFWTVGAMIAVLAAWAARWALRSAPAAQPATRERADRPRGIVFLGVLAFCCLVGEGAAADWSSVYLREDLLATPGIAAAGYAAFSIMMTAGRMAGDRLAARFGPVTLVRCCGLLAATGLGLALLGGHQVAGVIGFGCFGAGLSCIVPQVFSAAGHRDPAFAGRALARVASIGYLGMLSGPVFIGALAELTGLPRALAIPALLAAFVALTATALRVRTKEPASQAPAGQAPRTDDVSR